MNEKVINKIFSATFIIGLIILLWGASLWLFELDLQLVLIGIGITIMIYSGSSYVEYISEKDK